MPLYEYECSDCGKEFEVLVLDSDETVKCVGCDSENIGKQFSSFGLASGGDSSPEISGSGDSGHCPQSSCCCC